MKIFALLGAALVAFCQVASGFVIAPSAFAGSSVVSERCLVAECVVESSLVRRMLSYSCPPSLAGTCGIENSLPA